MSGSTLKTRVIEGRSPGPCLLITAGVHGDEFEPMAAVRRLASRVTPEDLAGRLILVPVVNEAAFEQGRRAGPDGLDLARTCPGRPDGNLTERTAHALSELIRSADYYIDLHSGGFVLELAPLSGYVLHANPEILKVQRQMARAFGLPLIWGTSAELEGRSLSIARDAAIPAIYVEGPGGCFNPQVVDSLAGGCLSVMGERSMIARQRPAAGEVKVFEDPRSGSGHMQACYPSPIAGFFEPSVRPGQDIDRGAALGTVGDVLGEHTETILAADRGIVLGIRSFCRVEQGTSLAVVLDWNCLVENA